VDDAKGHTDVQDLLTLIGDAIEQLQCCVELLEDAKREAGVARLTEVIAQIDRYIDRMDDDPLLRLAPIDHASLGERLRAVQGELSGVVDGFTSSAS